MTVDVRTQRPTPRFLAHDMARIDPIAIDFPELTIVCGHVGYRDGNARRVFGR